MTWPTRLTSISPMMPSGAQYPEKRSCSWENSATSSMIWWIVCCAVRGVSAQKQALQFKLKALGGSVQKGKRPSTATSVLPFKMSSSNKLTNKYCAVCFLWCQSVCSNQASIEIQCFTHLTSGFKKDSQIFDSVHEEFGRGLTVVLKEWSRAHPVSQ